MQKLKLRSGLFCSAPLPCAPVSNEIVYNQPGALINMRKFVCLFVYVCLLVNGNEEHHQYHGEDT